MSPPKPVLYLIDSNRSELHSDNIKLVEGFLDQYVDSRLTFSKYRTCLEKFILWCNWRNISLCVVTGTQAREFIEFCLDPPKEWRGTVKRPRMTLKNNVISVNPKWRPFISTVNKRDFKYGKHGDINQYEIGSSSIKQMLLALSGFYLYLIEKDRAVKDPVKNIKKSLKNKYFRTVQTRRIRKMTATQWECVLETAQAMADKAPNRHERTLFVISCLSYMYLRVSELVSTDRWTPTMNCFQVDDHGYWGFTTISKGNKERTIVVRPAMLEALKRWRKHLGKNSLPSLVDNSPLLPAITHKRAVSSISCIYDIVQPCLDRTVNLLKARGKLEEAQQLELVSVHWFRHTGISYDLNVLRRPEAHVRDDAGHSSTAVTNLYNEADWHERHASLIKK